MKTEKNINEIYDDKIEVTKLYLSSIEQKADYNEKEIRLTQVWALMWVSIVSIICFTIMIVRFIK